MSRQPDAEAGTEPRRTRRYLVWVALLVVVLLPFVFIEGPGSGILSSLGLIDRDESFSELSFPDRAALPTEMQTGATLAFDFAVRNREGAPTTYRWQARLDPPEPGTAVLARGRLRLGDGEARTVHVAEPASGVPGAAVVSVVLVDRTEAIHFPLTITAPGPVVPPG